MKKQQVTGTIDNDDVQEQEELDLDNIFNFSKEKESFKGHYTEAKYRDGKNIPFTRQTPIEETRWNNWIAKVTDVQSGKPFTSNEGLSSTPKGNLGPKRVVRSNCKT